jgi:exodeoxyribonuclease VII large subunit
VQAIEQLNALATPPDVIVVTRGGGSAEDLQAFSTEQVTRAVAASRVPTLVAIGHEIDLSLAELAADSRASTPSNAAELLVPDKHQVLAQLHTGRAELRRLMLSAIADARQAVGQRSASLSELVAQTITARRVSLQAQRQLLAALSPQTILQRGYAVVHKDGAVVRQAAELAAHDTIRISFADGSTRAIVTESED